jgi:hypothetical protein
MAKTDIATTAQEMEQPPMKRATRGRLRLKVVAACAAACLPAFAEAQVLPMDRLSGPGFEVHSPDLRVSGPPGDMRIDDAGCSQRNTADIRRRIVDIAVQEWAFFGFSVADQTGPPPPLRRGNFVRRPWMDPDESERVAASIAGYWSVTPDGGWILERQNDFWKGPLGVGERWRDPWSAAFISWTLCEAGLTESSEFRRSINHRTYIDQAIHARDNGNGNTAYVAYDIGELEIEPGDLLCSASRHGYRSLQDRRRALGEGARTHCDIVVHVDPGKDRIFGIGGNVLGRVSLKLIYAIRDPDDNQLHAEVGRGRRTVFAHLKLTAASSDSIGFIFSSSIQELSADPAKRSALEGMLQISLPDPGGS